MTANRWICSTGEQALSEKSGQVPRSSITANSRDNSSYFDPPVEWYFNERVDDDFKIKGKNSGRRLLSNNFDGNSGGATGGVRKHPLDDSFVSANDASPNDS